MKQLEIIFHTFLFLLICILVGCISATTIVAPIDLTFEEIHYYVDTAETVWHEGLEAVKEYDEIEIKCDLKNREVKIVPNNTLKKSITVNFSNTQKSISINKPIVSYWGCFIFYGFFFGTIAYMIIATPIVIIKKKFFKKFNY